MVHSDHTFTAEDAVVAAPQLPYITDFAHLYWLLVVLAYHGYPFLGGLEVVVIILVRTGVRIIQNFIFLLFRVFGGG